MTMLGMRQAGTDRVAAEGLAAAGPDTQAGRFERIVIHPWKKVLPKE